MAVAKLVPILIIAGLVALVGGGFGYTLWQQNRCPGHWHASFYVYVDGARVSFDDPHFYLEGSPTYNRMPISSHVHQGRDYVFHFEPSPIKCIKLQDATPYVGMTLSDDRLVLSGAHDNIQLQGTTHNQGGTYLKGTDANHTLEYYHKLPNAAWEATTAKDLNGRQLKDGERILVIYGGYGDNDLAGLEASVPLPPEYQQGHPGAT